MLEAVRRDIKSAECELAEIPEKKRQCLREIDEMTTLGMNAPGPNAKESAFVRKKRAMLKLENLKREKEELEERIVEGKAKSMKVMEELAQTEAAVRKRESYMDDCRRRISDLEEAKSVFPSLDDALRTWEIGVRILGFEEEGMK
jgi:chromosome segregation ATPase